MGEKRTITREPTNDYGCGTISAGNNKEECKVLHMNSLLIIDSQEDNDPGDTDCKTTKNEGKPMADGVTCCSDKHGEGESNDPRWDRSKLGMNRCHKVRKPTKTRAR